MPAGIKIINDAHTILIDDTSPSLALRQKTVSSNSGIIVPNISVPNAETPSVAFSCSANCTLYSATGTTTRTFGLRVEYGTPNGVSVASYVFDRPLPTVSTYGLIIRDSAGNVTFDALQKYGRVVALRTSNGVFTGTAGRVYAAMILSSIYRDEIVAGNSISTRIRRISVTGARTSGHTLTVVDQILSQLEYPSSETIGVIQSRGAAKVLILDVTGY